MALRFVAVTFDVRDPTVLGAFWAELLGRQQVTEIAGVLLPGDETQVGLRFVAADVPESAPYRLHLHLTSSSLDDRRRTLDEIVRLGGRHIDVGQQPDDDHVVMADPAGNAFCVIEPGNNFLADCGFIGALSSDGSQQVGYFWSEALGWPLVWDQDGETAIQSPHGGTKVAWGGPPVAPKVVRNRQRFHLAPVGDDQQAELDRLVSLGATQLEVAEDGAVELADPDGNEFRVA